MATKKSTTRGKNPARMTLPELARELAQLRRDGDAMLKRIDALTEAAKRRHDPKPSEIVQVGNYSLCTVAATIRKYAKAQGLTAAPFLREARDAELTLKAWRKRNGLTKVMADSAWNRETWAKFGYRIADTPARDWEGVGVKALIVAHALLTGETEFDNDIAASLEKDIARLAPELIGGGHG